MKNQIKETFSKISVAEDTIEKLIVKLQSADQINDNHNAEKHRFNWGKKRIILTLSGALGSLLLILGIILFPFINQNGSHLAMKIIEKDSYEEFLAFIEKAQQSRPEKKPYLLEYDFPVQSTFVIAGVVNLKDPDEYNVRYREYFIASTLPDGANMTVIYQPKTVFDKASLQWQEGEGGSYSRSEEHLRTYDKRFILVDKTETKVLGLKFNNATTETIEAMFNYFIGLI